MNEVFILNVALLDHEKYVTSEEKTEKDGGETRDEGHINIHPVVNHRVKVPLIKAMKPEPRLHAGLTNFAVDLTKLGPNLNLAEIIDNMFGYPWVDELTKGDLKFTLPQYYYAKQARVFNMS